MQSAAFRQEVLQHLIALRARWPGGSLHLLYVPGIEDPLQLLAGHARVQAIARDLLQVDADDAFLPHVITLDCRKVAAYLLETDPALDDPLLEASIALAAEGIIGNDGRTHAVCGWLASPDDASTIARRLGQAAHRFDSGARRTVRVRWHDPRVLSHLWPQLPAAQRTALLGTRLVWVAVGAMNRVTVFDVEASETVVTARMPTQSDTTQWTRLRHVGMVNRLLELWRERLHEAGTTLPEDAIDVLHRHAAQASAHGLDGRDAQTYVLLAVGLRVGFEQDPHWRDAIHAATDAPGTFEDHAQALPATFWERYATARV
ncbi:DUF4123 domain-containing protein [Ralstonia pseudosolanacearum]|uniref:DUF4123 domain-containing protein n=1 Tax=Ralstonia pseudosolanacearum TaxID=1310165 RepID=UPI003AAC1D4B